MVCHRTRETASIQDRFGRPARVSRLHEKSKETAMAWFQQYEKWAKYTLEGKEFLACPCYIWSDESEQYYRHWVYYCLAFIPGLNTQDFFYFRDADANNVYWCRCWREGLTELRWSYLSPSNYRITAANLRDDMFPALMQARSLSIAGVNVPLGQPVDSSCVQKPPPDPFLETDPIKDSQK